MQTLQQRGEIVELTAPYDRKSGEGALVGSQFGVAMSDVTNATVGSFLTEGVVVLKKTDSQAWVQGDPIYWDDSNKRCDNTVVGPMIGTALAAVASTPGLVTGVVKLKEAPSKPPQAAIAALTDNSGGASADGTIGAVTIPTLNWAGSTDPTAQQATDINACLTALKDAIKELSTKVNEIQSKLKSAAVTL